MNKRIYRKRYNIKLEKKNVKEVLENSKIDNEIILNIEEIFHAYDNPFHGLDSEYKWLQFFKEKGSFIEAEHFVIGTKNISKRHKGQFSLTPLVNLFLLQKYLMDYLPYQDF